MRELLVYDLRARLAGSSGAMGRGAPYLCMPEPVDHAFFSSAVRSASLSVPVRRRHRMRVNCHKVELSHQMGHMAVVTVSTKGRNITQPRAVAATAAPADSPCVAEAERDARGNVVGHLGVST